MSDPSAASKVAPATARIDPRGTASRAMWQGRFSELSPGTQERAGREKRNKD